MPDSVERQLLKKTPVRAGNVVSLISSIAKREQQKPPIRSKRVNSFVFLTYHMPDGVWYLARQIAEYLNFARIEDMHVHMTEPPRQLRDPVLIRHTMRLFGLDPKRRPEMLLLISHGELRRILQRVDCDKSWELGYQLNMGELWRPVGYTHPSIKLLIQAFADFEPYPDFDTPMFPVDLYFQRNQVVVLYEERDWSLKWVRKYHRRRTAFFRRSHNVLTFLPNHQDFEMGTLLRRLANLLYSEDWPNRRPPVEHEWLTYHPRRA